MGQLEMNRLTEINDQIPPKNGGVYQTLIVNEITTEAYQAGNPFQSFLYFPTPPPGTTTTYNGALITVLPVGVTPVPTAAPSYPPTPPPS
jgi:hypothetical protein